MDYNKLKREEETNAKHNIAFGMSSFYHSLICCQPYELEARFSTSRSESLEHFVILSF